MNILKPFFFAAAAVAFSHVQAAEQFIEFTPSQHSVELTSSTRQQAEKVIISIDDTEFNGVKIAAENLCSDFERVTGRGALLVSNSANRPKIIVGTIEKSKTIGRLIKQGVIDGKALKGRREKFIITTMGEGNDATLIIAGSDKRGAIYGIYELSQQMGVSPWHYWADVPTPRHENIFVTPGTYTDGEPAVRYRGIFINDEWPAFGNWAREAHGGINSKMYVHMYELILRLKGNFLWPAMWGSAFYADDPESSRLADEMGIVMSTSHHEPMARNHQEYARNRKKYGAWNYETNQEGIDRFFREGIERLGDKEEVVTIGMRGDGDEAMGKNANVALLERIVANQRKIIADVTGRPAKKTPQVWALYKEVQEYYEKGMRVPDDVILLLCDDNWGNVRLLPELGEKKHKGGYGMYYHVDYVGGPRNTKWINVSQIQRIWEQMSLTYDYGVDQIWVLNVGDLKPMEMPIDFFLKMAWNPKQFNAGNLMAYTEDFCREQLGDKAAKEAARILNLQGKYVHRCTAEMLSAKTYSLETGEWDRVLGEYKRLEADALNQYMDIAPQYKDTYNELILFPVRAMANLYDMYYAYAMNEKLAAMGNIEANAWAKKARACYDRDSVLCAQYNHKIADGKWNHMMDQVHIGYTSWQEPKKRYFPATKQVEAGTTQATATKGEATLQRGYVFRKQNNVVAMEAEHYFSLTNAKDAQWTIIPDFGKTLSGLALMPYTASTDGGQVTYAFNSNTQQAEKATLHLYLAPSFPFNGNRGHRVKVCIDGKEVSTININKNQRNDYKWQGQRINLQSIPLPIEPRDGMHELTICPLDPGVVLERIVINWGKESKTYLGTPETSYTIQHSK